VHEQALLQLLHLADSALPIGAAAHSFGLETLAEENVVMPATLERFLFDHLEESGTLEAWFVARAYALHAVAPHLVGSCTTSPTAGAPQTGRAHDNIDLRRDSMERVRRLNDEFSARKPARESREASLKLGRRFAELVNAVSGIEIATDVHYPIAFGAACAALSIPEDAAVLAYLQQSITGLISACQRLMPLGQIAAAKILWNLKPAMVVASQRAIAQERISCFNPLPELASMRHSSIETRLFIS
jgi:urease accessory protein